MKELHAGEGNKRPSAAMLGSLLPDARDLPAGTGVGVCSEEPRPAWHGMELKPQERLRPQCAGSAA